MIYASVIGEAAKLQNINESQIVHQFIENILKAAKDKKYSWDVFDYFPSNLYKFVSSIPKNQYPKANFFKPSNLTEDFKEEEEKKEQKI